MTDNEIIKAMDICGHLEACAECPLGDMEGVDKCMHTLLQNALDLINRLKEENEDLRQIVFTDRSEAIKNLKSAARKEFAERLKEKAWIGFWETVPHVDIDDIDSLLEEMTERRTKHERDTFPW